MHSLLFAKTPRALTGSDYHMFLAIKPAKKAKGK
jgi:hypothetical protein